MALAITSVWLITGCDSTARQAPSAQPAPRTTEIRRVLSVDELDETFFSTDDQQLRWYFSKPRFVIESYREPIPADLARRLLGEELAVYRIAGTWTIGYETGRPVLDLADIVSDYTAQPRTVRLHAIVEGSDEVQVEEHRYRWTNGPSVIEGWPRETYRGWITDTMEGDQLMIRSRDGDHRVQLAGVVCPQPGQLGCDEARARVQQLSRNHFVAVKVYDTTSDGTEIAQVWLSSLTYLNLELLREGLAWHDKRTDNQWVLSTAEDDARQSKSGIWSEPNPVPPWDWTGRE